MLPHAIAAGDVQKHTDRQKTEGRQAQAIGYQSDVSEAADVGLAIDVLDLNPSSLSLPHSHDR